VDFDDVVGGHTWVSFQKTKWFKTGPVGIQ